MTAIPSSSAPSSTADAVTSPQPSSSSSKPFLTSPTPSSSAIRSPMFSAQPLLGKPINPPAPPPSPHGILYPVGAAVHRGFPVRSAGAVRSVDQLVTVANPAGYLRSSSPMAVMNFAAAMAAASQARPYVYGGVEHTAAAAAAAAAASHGMRPPPPQGQQQAHHFVAPRTGASRGASVPAHPKVTSLPAMPLAPEHSDTKERDKSIDDAFVMIHGRKVRVVDGGSCSLYALCRSWIQSGLTQETHVDDLEYLKNSGLNTVKVAKAFIEVFAEMIFVHGFVHGDPHPGNILVSVEGNKGFSLVLLDHGIYRELDEQFRLDYCKLWKALILLDSQNIINVGKQFGVGKYSKYFPVIFTGRTLQSKSALGTQMSKEEKKRLKQELQYLRMEDISSFMESLPPEFLSILRTDGLLSSISRKLGAPRRMRLLAYAKYAVYGLATRYCAKSDKYGLSKFGANMSHLQLRAYIEIMAFLLKIEDFRHSLAVKIKRILREVTEVSQFVYGVCFSF